MNTPGLPEPAVAAPAGAETYRSALIEFRAGRMDAAVALAQAAARADSAGSRIDAQILLARIARRQGKVDQALAAIGPALEAAIEAADPARECRARTQHAHVLNALQLMEAALEEGYRALRLAEFTGDAASEAVACEALAAAHWSMSQWPEAVAAFQRMLDNAVAAGDLELQMVAHGGLAGSEKHGAQLALADVRKAGFERALAHVLDYLRLATALGDAHSMRAARHAHAAAMSEMGDRLAARAALDTLLAETADDETRAMTLCSLAELDLHDGDAAAAASRLERAHALIEVTEDIGYLTSCCYLLCAAHEALGDLGAALSWHRRFHDLHVRMSSQNAQVHARALSVKYETDRAQASAAFERLRAQRFERAALEDSLTGLANRRAFDRMLDEALAAAAYGRSFGLALLDLDHFKQINDTFSHLVGDEVLRRVGSILAATARQADFAARYGGEEFGLLLVAADAQATRQACERVRCAVEAADWAAVAPGLVVRLSIGCVYVEPPMASAGATALLTLADRRLYAAKAGGRNGVVSEDEAA